MWSSDLEANLKSANKQSCDLSRENVPNAERNGKQMGDERLGKPFETGNVNG